ncbi:MAG: hypothetical protein V3U34_00475 [candidate division NC10 bacterium]
MAIELQVTLRNGQTYNYWKLIQISTIRESMADPKTVLVAARYGLYKDAAAFAGGMRSDAVLNLDVTINRVAIGSAAYAEESLVDDAVIAAAKVEQMGQAEIDTSDGTKVV